MGILSPLGIGVEANWEALVCGRSGISAVTKFDASDLKTQIAGEVKDFQSEDFLSRKEARRLDLFIHYAMAASRMTIEDSGLKVTEENAEKIGCVLGCGLGGLNSIETYHKVMLDKGPGRITPFFIPMLISNMAPGQISIEYGLKGPTLSFSTACAAGTHAIGQSFRMIQSGEVLAVFAGGAEAVITKLGMAGFNAMRAISTRNDEPEKASRPFDLDRDGFVMAEGAGILLLEELEHALERGAPIHAEVIGFGMSSDAFDRVATPEGGTGAVQCMRAAINDANITAADVDYINAHGTSTTINDISETQAIKTVFGDRAGQVQISSTKSMTGHLLGAAGGVESVYSILAIERGIIPPTINYETPDPECDLDYVPNKARESQVNVAMSNSFGFGGTNGTLIFKAYSSS
ncbi:MAG: beta-ketoacyl-ACP synthase II [Deltaproteobacteria bacterium]|nr:beta-ketoacyl-ACP synthase II [Deltaproteobacteria bacterium]MBW2050898.1 beta-ketoacyl-ACP synthase II [Deltaproteobacteria bacterium]MBW2139557.1 beta-ketoacyl-ACP synthase II [Deltaproteobacteria bacterium]MBW2322608.1 beta-ketoacyl-ACP synthase II [Deltaproteobacteria bacterium]